MELTREWPSGAVVTTAGVRLGEVEFIWARNSREFLFSNSILIHGDKPILVDPSASFTFLENLAKAHFVTTVFNTHYHADHRSLNHLFKGVIFAAHEKDAAAISDHREYARISDADPHSYYTEWTLEVFQKYKIIECPVALKLKDNSLLSSGGEEIKIIPLPGHTPGHCGLYFKSIDCLYVSDIDLTPHGPWYANVVSDLPMFRDTVAQLKNFSATHYVSSHGERIYDREKFLEKLNRFERHFYDREEKILDFLKEGPQELAHLVSQGIVYKQSALIDPLKAYFQFQMVEKHLLDLESRGLVAREGNVVRRK